MSNSPYDLERHPQPTAEDLAEFNAGVRAARVARRLDRPEPPSRPPLRVVTPASADQTVGCPITMPGQARTDAEQWRDRKCGKPIDRYGFCAKHADDRDRLMGGR